MKRCSQTLRIGLLTSTLLSTAFLSGCGGSLFGAAYEASPSVTSVVKTCPVPRTYSPAEKARAKQEAAVLPKDSELDAMIEDYSVLAQQARDCQ